MHITIMNESTGAKSLYTLAQLRREAYAVAKQERCKVRDYFIEVRDTGVTSLAVHVVRKDGIGEIIRVAI